MTEVESTASENVSSKRGRRLPSVLLIVGVVLVLATYVQVFALLVYTWLTNRDYSYCFVVPLVSAYLLWRNRAEIREAAEQRVGGGLVRGIVLLVAAFLLRFIGLASNSLWIQALSLVPLVLGFTTLKWGRPTARLVAPAILFLIFMIPAPIFVAGLLNAVLQALATMISTYMLQTFGVPSISEGNVIFLDNGQIDVAAGCSGLYSFFALTFGACLVLDRIRIEKILIVISTIPIGIVSNSIAIIAVGIAYGYLAPETAEYIFQSVTPWFMLPLGLLFVCFVLAILNRLFVREE